MSQDTFQQSISRPFPRSEDKQEVFGRFTFLTLIFLYIIFSGTDVDSSGSEITFSKQFPTTSSIQSVIPTRDAGFLAVGGGSSQSSLYTRPLAIKLDAQGRVKWRMEYRTSESYSTYFTSGIETKNGTFLLIGSRDNVHSSDTDPFVLKADRQGKLLWSKVIEAELPDRLFGIVESADNGYIVGGNTSTYSMSSPSDALLIKIGSSGALLWSRTFGRSQVDDDDTIRSIIKVKDGFILAGSSDFFTRGPSKALIMKVDPTGLLKWKRIIFRTGGWLELLSANGTKDDGIVATGNYLASIQSPNIESFLMRIRPNGSVAWIRSLGAGGHDETFSVAQTSEGDFLIAGQTDSFGFGSDDGLLVKFNRSGKKVWSWVLGQEFFDNLNFVARAQDGGFIASGIFGGATPVLLKLDASGLVEDCTNFGSVSIPARKPRVSASNVEIETTQVTVNLKNAGFRSFPSKTTVKPGCAADSSSVQ